jgi:8-oxo-dGTP pyrophosphatase MutT (NUDIX family)
MSSRSSSPAGGPASDSRPDFVGVYGWLEEDRQVLLVATRRDLGAAGKQICWELPGGKVEAGEAPEEALRREIREETGLDVRVGEPFLVFRGERLTAGVRKYDWEGRFYYLQRLGGALGSTDRETVAVRMAGLDELPALFTAPYHAPILRWLESGRRLRTDRLTWDDAAPG